MRNNMSKFVIYHNPRCSKSRQTLAILEENEVEIEIVEYLKNPLNKKNLSSLIKKLKIKPKELVRTKEKVFKELDVDLENDAAVIKAIVENPALMERPIVEKKDRAIIGRPPENVLDLL